MAKVKRSLRFGKVFDDLEKLLQPGETMTSVLEQFMGREVARRMRAKKNAPPEPDETSPR